MKGDMFSAGHTGGTLSKFMNRPAGEGSKPDPNQEIFDRNLRKLLYENLQQGILPEVALENPCKVWS